MSVPSWLDPNTEVPKTAVQVSKTEFVLSCVNKLLSLGCDHAQAFGVTANAVLECGWGQHLYNGNAFGWKINQSYAKAYKSRTGRSARWWRAVGNVRSGDAPEVYYRVFDSYVDALSEWLENFVPKGASSRHRYKTTGDLFWSHGDWFPALIQAGYKGDVTKENPGPSIHNHDLIYRDVMEMWVQSRLGVVVDGKFGPKSQKALADFQKAHGLNPTGEITEDTLLVLG